jgi:putative FmdB family regulatory protein
MPIYAYKCSACGFAKDVLQKISDAPLRDCLSCGQPAFEKQVTAAGFQLKGSGWYVTDFRGGKTEAPAGAEGAVPPKTEKGADAATASSASGSDTPPTAPAAATPAPAASPAPAAPSAAPAASA